MPQASASFYDAGRNKIEALNGIDPKVQRGEVVAVMGPSGHSYTHLGDAAFDTRRPTPRARAAELRGRGSADLRHANAVASVLT